MKIHAKDSQTHLGDGLEDTGDEVDTAPPGDVPVADPDDVAVVDPVEEGATTVAVWLIATESSIIPLNVPFQFSTVMVSMWGPKVSDWTLNSDTFACSKVGAGIGASTLFDKGPLSTVTLTLMPWDPARRAYTVAPDPARYVNMLVV